MIEDIVPGLLEMIESQFDESTLNSSKIKNVLKKLDSKKASYSDVNDFAIEVGEILAEIFGKNISSAALPDGRMYYNIAERLLNPTMTKNHEMISDFARQVQTELNHQSGIRIRAQVPELNQDKIDGIINRISSEKNFDDIKWILEEPIVHFSQSVVDDTIKLNAEFHAKAGLQPQITRTVSGHKPCKWCKNLAGTYDYYDAPDDIYRRHDRCRCIVEYEPGNGKRQDVWSKKWNNYDKEEKIERRKQIDPSEDKYSTPDSINKRLLFLRNEMDKLEDEEWGNLTEEQAERLYDKYDTEYGRLAEKLSVLKYNKDEDTTYIYSKGDPLEFFRSNSNYEEWKNNLTIAEKEVVLSYTGNGYKNINEILRDGEEAYLNNFMYKGTPMEYKQKMIRHAKEMQQIVDNFEVKEDFITYRAISGSFGDLGELKDVEVFDSGFMSTSIDQKVTKDFAGGDSNVFFSIRVKKGTKVGAYLDELSDYSGEKEFLIKPNTKFKVINSHEEKSDYGVNQYIELEAIE